MARVTVHLSEWELREIKRAMELRAEDGGYDIEADGGSLSRAEARGIDGLFRKIEKAIACFARP